MNENKYSLFGIIDHFEETMAVIVTDNGQKILWPIKNLPDNVVKDQKVRLTLSTQMSEEIEQQAIAKHLLNEILIDDRKNAS